MSYSTLNLARQPLLACTILALALTGCASRGQTGSSVGQTVATAPGCDPGDNPASPVPSLGCANRENLKAMLANPADYDHGRALTPADGQREVMSIEAYRKGQVRKSTTGTTVTGSSMPQGADLVREVNHPGAGLLVDYWHIFRANTTLEEMERRVPVEYIFGIELNDALDEIVGTLFEDTRDNRKLLGEGDQDVIGFIKTIQRMGYKGDWGVEILSAEQRSKPLLEGLQDAIDSAKRAFELASNSNDN